MTFIALPIGKGEQVVILAGAVTEETVPTNDVQNPSESAEPVIGPAEELAQARAEGARLKDQLLRTAADFDNFRKRTRKELADAERRAREDLLRDLLPVFDNLERAVQHAGNATDIKALSDGVGMVLRQFLDTLGRVGVTRIQAQNQAFDPTQHEAVQQLETAEFAPGTVVNEVQAGYRVGDYLIRPALVVVAKPKSD